jgi:hypothetical protein
MVEEEEDDFSFEGFLADHPYPVPHFKFEWEEDHAITLDPGENPFYARTGYAARLLHRVLALSGFHETQKASSANLILGTLEDAEMRRLASHQRVSHFTHTFSLGSKTGYHHVITAFADRIGDRSAISFYPESFCLPDDYAALQDVFATGTGTWISKPGGGARGEGSRVINEMPAPSLSRRIVQRYIPNPLLINGLKFDLRFYVAVMSLNPLRIYVHENGLVRLATEEYNANVTDLANESAHLTNFSINRNNPAFKATDDMEQDGTGNKWTHRPFWEWLGGNGFDPNAIRAKIEDALVTTIIASREVFLAQTTHRLSFEVFGFDVMLDADGNVYILEVNVTPALGTSSGLDLFVKGPLVRDFFNLALIPKPGEAATKLEACLAGDNQEVIDYIAICEYELAQANAGAFRCIYPTVERIASHGPTLATRTPPDQALERWLGMNDDERAAYLEDGFPQLENALDLSK